MKPVFLLGVGAQKAATTWIYKLLSSQLYANFGFTKEYHVWDAKYILSCQDFLVDTELRSRNVRYWSQQAQKIRRYMQIDDKFYYSYFRSLMGGDLLLTGDITPTYGMLDGHHFNEIRSKLTEAGFLVKVIFVMREPVNRNWSAIRMYKRNQEKKFNKKIEKSHIESIFINYAQDNANYMRTRYDKTLISVREAFERDDIFVSFYENIFSVGEVERLSEFLGLPISSPQFNLRVNQSDFWELPDELRHNAQNIYTDVYKFVEQEFPEGHALWQEICV